MQELDLKKDKPEEFEGKRIALNGQNYTIGPEFRSSDQGWMHHLVNEQSGLSLLMIQIRPEYQDAPETALAISRRKETETAKLRTRMRFTQHDVPISVLSVIEGHGGSFELHESLSVIFHSSVPDPLKDQLHDLAELADTGKAVEAVEKARALHKEHPFHSELMSLLVELLSQIGERVEANDIAKELVKIEPSSIRYEAQRLRGIINSGNVKFGMSDFENMRERFPHVDDFNEYGIRGYLNTGDLEKAEALIQETLLPDEAKERYLRLLGKGKAAHGEYTLLERRLADGEFDAEGGLRLLMTELTRLLKGFPENPWIRVNLGLVLKRSGNPKEAAHCFVAAQDALDLPFIPYCAASTAQCFVEMEKYDEALSSYEFMAKMLSLTTEGKYKAVDLPGNVNWIYQNGSIHERTEPPPSAPLNQAITHCSDKTLITPTIKRLQSLYAEVDHLYANKKKQSVAPPADSSRPPFNTATTWGVSLTLCLFAFYGAFNVFARPVVVEMLLLGVAALAPVVLGVGASLKKEYVKKSPLHLVVLVVLPILAFGLGAVTGV